MKPQKLYKTKKNPILLFVISMVFTLSFFPATSQDEEVSAADAADSGWTFEQMPFNYQNIQVPREIWEKIKETLRTDGVKSAVIEDFSVLPISLQVELFSEDRFVLKDGLNHRLLYIEGGGELDMFDYVSGKGPFNFRLSPHFTDGKDFHLLYISDSPGKKVGGDQWGNGCGRIYDLTQNAQVFLQDEGIRVTSSRRHYLHLMAGTFIFFQLIEDRLFLGYIRVKDSRYPQFECRNS